METSFCFLFNNDVSNSIIVFPSFVSKLCFQVDPKHNFDLGTGNDLSQVLGWGTVCSNDSNVPQIINHVERATTKMLDRWSVLTYDGPPIVSGSDMPTNDEAELNNYLDTILDNQNPEKVHKAVDGLYELSKKVQISRLSKFLDLIQKAGWTNNADVNQVRTDGPRGLN